LRRVGFLYGKFNEDKTVKVELIYEPPQETTDTSFTILPDSKEVSGSPPRLYVSLLISAYHLRTYTCAATGGGSGGHAGAAQGGLDLQPPHPGERVRNAAVLSFSAINVEMVFDCIGSLVRSLLLCPTCT
jgi:hypothetical protein